MSKQTNPSSQSVLAIESSSPTRRGVINLMSAGVGLIVGTQINGRKDEGVKMTLNPSSSQGHTQFSPTIGLDLDPENFMIHGHTPLTVEAKRHTIGTSVITHEKHLYIRNNLPMPNRSITIDPDRWVLEIKGVKGARSLTVAELKQIGLHTVTAVLQCSGNGRAFYTHGPSGSQWSTGAAGCVVWSGVKLSDVIAHLGGLSGEPKYLTSTGGDPLPEGIDPLAVVVERSIPIAKALKDAMLAWEMNGDQISLEHGGPLRLIIPGYFGCNQIKYVKRLNFTSEQTQSKIQKAGYRLRPIGEKGSADYPSMWAMPIKSWLTNEVQGFGTHQVLRGVAMGGERSISRVEISVDEGKTWLEASLIGPDLGPFAWRLFQVPIELQLGQHIIMSRAYDDQELSQPEQRYENERGYGHNGWRDHALTITISPLSEQKKIRSTTPKLVHNVTQIKGERKPKRNLSAKAQRGKEIFLKDTQPNCGICHTLNEAQTTGAIGPNLDQLQPSVQQIKTAVSKGLGAMPAQKHLSEQQLNDLALYIFESTRK